MERHSPVQSRALSLPHQRRRWRGTSLSRIGRGRLRDPVTSGEMMPGARGGLSRVTVCHPHLHQLVAHSLRTLWGLLGSHRSPIPCYFSGQCCNPGHKELGCGLLPSRPSWSQGTSLMKATPGNFPGCGGSNHRPQGNCGDLMRLHRTTGPGVREPRLAPGSWSQLPRLHTAQAWCHFTSRWSESISYHKFLAEGSQVST